LVAAITTPESFTWAGQQGYGLMFVPYLSDFQDLAQKLELYRRAYREARAGEEPPPVSMAFHLYVAESTEVARREARAYIEQYVAVFKDSATAWIGRQSAQYRGYEQLHTLLNAMTYERVLAETRAFIGDPATVFEQMRQVRDIFGPVQPEMQIMFGDMPYEKARRSVELFGHHVLPALQAL
jgi:alkanesulfonate monooxygenase SsuD/methylene tetrahydromethanopterin reductase-like flavin-dependent oxidoreductase (luciferase family)